MEIYVPEAVAQDIIAISKSFHVDAKSEGVSSQYQKTDNQ
jgi:hypothetical protein